MRRAGSLGQAMTKPGGRPTRARSRFLIAALGVVAAPAIAGASCSSGPPPAAIVADAGPGEAGGEAGAGFGFQQLGCGAAGTQSVIAVSGNTVGVASLASTTMTQTCMIMPMQMTTTSQVPLWNVCYAEGQFQGMYNSQVVTSQPYVTATGVGLAFDSQGNAGIAYTGVGAMPAMERCGGNDSFLVKASAGTFGAPVQVSQGSMSDGLVASQAGNCSQGVCNEGDVTGWWPALAFDPSDNPFMAYRDVHFGFAVSDLTAKCDVELAEGQGGNFSVLTVDVSRGGGQYNRLAFTPQGLPVVAQYNTGGRPGVYVDQALVGGSVTAQAAAGGWTSSQPFSGQIGPQLGFGINSKGLMALAYFDATANRLFYIESNDGSTWSAPAAVDNDGLTGQYPSLAFDPSGNPAIAYYRCSANMSLTQCDPAQDGLYLARRMGGTWSVQTVHADSSVSDGLYPALAFVNGHAAIAFQITSFDPVSGTSSATWWIAEEQ
jgi:hypothetical protein